jgi:hypothetical protein
MRRGKKVKSKTSRVTGPMRTDNSRLKNLFLPGGESIVVTASIHFLLKVKTLKTKKIFNSWNGGRHDGLA